MSYPLNNSNDEQGGSMGGLKIIFRDIDLVEICSLHLYIMFCYILTLYDIIEYFVA